MEVTFEKEYLLEIFKKGRSYDKKHRFQPEIIRKYIRIIELMISVPDTYSLRKFKSLNYENLKGEKLGLSSVRVNNRYRIEFEELKKENQSIASICNITDLSNHYQ
ncbi:MAG: type II toxin-antitoxin system RelE/ParE family toxin [Paludibacter sp.]|jgi:proteic killer suppression protein|nr:type II toxin-antitoxin system RelE/ParE family toxin [Paludibacter sp.]